MKYRPFGHTGWHVSDVGIGTWTMGGMWGPVDEAEAVRALHRALDLGVNFIDTALVYGDGRSEQLIAKALSGRQDTVYVASKIPPKNMEWPARDETDHAQAFPSEWIIKCTERSLRNLRRETLDLQQLHVWAPTWLVQRAEWIDTVARLKQQGKIRAFGISINDHQPDTALELVDAGLIDSVQVIYNIFDQMPAERLLPACARQHVGVIARVPFDEGSLTGALTKQTVFDADDWRADYFRGDRLGETVDRVGRVREAIGDGASSLACEALRFCLSHPAVSTVIPGMRRVSHVEQNCAASQAGPLSEPVMKRLLAQAWPRNFYPWPNET